MTGMQRRSQRPHLEALAQCPGGQARQAGALQLAPETIRAHAPGRDSCTGIACSEADPGGRSTKDTASASRTVQQLRWLGHQQLVQYNCSVQVTSVNIVLVHIPRPGQMQHSLTQQ